MEFWFDKTVAIPETLEVLFYKDYKIVTSNLNKHEVENLVGTQCKMWNPKAETYSVEEFKTIQCSLKKNIYLDGVACLGKTTILKKLQREGFIVYFNEYFDIYNKYKPTSQTNEIISTMQSFFEIEKLNDLYVNPHGFGFHDRTHLSTIIYRMIFMRMNHVNYGELFKFFIPKMLKFASEHVVIFMLLQKFDDMRYQQQLLKKMKDRNNGLDVFSLDYIEAQQKVFEQIYKCCPNIIATYRNPFTFGDVVFENRLKAIYLHQALVENSVAEYCFYNNSVLLETRESYFCKKNQSITIKFSQKVFIPPNMIGLIFLRQKYSIALQASSYVLKSFYNDNIELCIVPIRDINLLKNEAIAEIIFINNENSYNLYKCKSVNPFFNVNVII